MAVVAAVLIATALLLAAPIHAQVFSGAQTASVFAVKNSGLTITPVSGGGQTVTMTDGAVSQFAAPVTVKLDWNFAPNQVNNVALIGYFASAASALSTGSSSIPSGWVEGRQGTTSGWAPFTQSYSVPSAANAANALLLHTTGSTRTSNRKGTVTVDVYLRLNLTGRTVPPGDYTGTLVLQAISQ